MKLTRRNALIGLGTAAAGAGVVGGTGAFTTATADRSISVSTTGDGASGAAITIEVNPTGDHNELTDSSGSGNAVVIDFSNLNVDTKFTFDQALRINPQEAENNVDISITSTPNGIGISPSTSGDNTTEEGYTNISSGTNVDFDMTVDLRDTSASNVSGDIVIEITEN